MQNLSEWDLSCSSFQSSLVIAEQQNHWLEGDMYLWPQLVPTMTVPPQFPLFFTVLHSDEACIRAGSAQDCVHG